MHTVTLTCGTLILAIPCQEGIVIAADRLAADVGTANIVYERKILGIKPRSFKHAPAIFGVTGMASLNNKTHNLHFNAQRAVSNFYAGKDPAKTAELLQKLAAKISNDFYSSAKGVTDKTFTDQGFLIGDNLFNVIVLYTDRSAIRGIRGAALEFSILQNTQLGAKMINVHDGELEKKHVHAFGIKNIVDGILGNDSRFEIERQNPIVSSVLNHTPTEVPMEKAIEIARFLIKISSEKISEVYQGPGGISPDADIAIILPSKGVKWIQQA